MQKKKTNKTALIILLIVEMVLLLVITVVKPFKGLGSPADTLIGMILTRGLGGVLFVVLIRMMHYPILKPNRYLSGVLPLDILLPVVIVINNFPIECLSKGEGKVTSAWYMVILLAVECLCIGFFEETAFRGFFMCAALERFHKSKFQVWMTVLVSSVLFGLIHLLNLVEGSGFGSVIQQVGYSMLTGAMCAIVFILTGNIWISVIIHAGFDFCGMLLPTLGYGSWFYRNTIIVTVILAIGVGVYLALRLLKKATPEYIEQFLHGSIKGKK